MTLVWDEEFGARFKSLSDRDVEIWQEIIENEIRNLASGELLSAVRLLGEQKRKGEIKYTPTVENIISAIIKNRYLARQSLDGNIPSEKCSLCIGGWIGYYEDSKTHEIGKRENGYYEMNIPCLCSMGEKVRLKSYKSEDQDEIKNLAYKVKDWIISILEDIEDLRFKKCA